MSLWSFLTLKVAKLSMLEHTFLKYPETIVLKIGRRIEILVTMAGRKEYNHTDDSGPKIIDIGRSSKDNIAEA